MNPEDKEASICPLGTVWIPERVGFCNKRRRIDGQADRSRLKSIKSHPIHRHHDIKEHHDDQQRNISEKLDIRFSDPFDPSIGRQLKYRHQCTNH